MTSPDSNGHASAGNGHTLGSGEQLGPYRVVSLIGSGGMGEVYRARDSRLGRDVALKVMPPSVDADPERLHRFEREARAMAALNHPNIVTVFDVGAHRRRPYVVSELLEGQTLRSRLGRGPLPTKTAVRWAHEFSQGLAAAHEKGIIHRDLKPENLFITRNGHLKILDFGLAKLMKVGAAAAITTAARDSQPGTIVGTVGYMSPEQIIGQPVDQRSDIFCFGVILYEMLTGRSPFQRENAIETMRAIVKDQPPSLSIEGDALLTVLDRIVQRCLEKDPDRRFQAAQHILDFRGAQLILAIDLQSERATEHRPAESQVDDDEERDHIHHWIVPFVLSLAISLLAALPFLLFFLFDRIWLEHSPSVRFATLLLAVAALHLIGSAIGRAVPFAGSTFHAVGTIAFGGAIFLTAQTFNLDQRWSIGMLLWVIGAWAAWRLVDDDAQVYLVALLTPAWLVSEWLVMTESASVAGQPLLSAGLTLLAFAYFTAPQSTRLFARGHVLRVIGGLAILPAISSVWIAGRSPVAARSGDRAIVVRIGLAWLGGGTRRSTRPGDAAAKARRMGERGGGRLDRRGDTGSTPVIRYPEPSVRDLRVGFLHLVCTGCWRHHDAGCARIEE